MRQRLVADSGRVSIRRTRSPTPASVLLVVRLELVGTADDLAVQRVLDAVLDGDDDGLVHLVADDETLAGLAEAARLLVRRGGAAIGCSSHIRLAHQALSTVSMPSSRSRIRV